MLVDGICGSKKGKKAEVMRGNGQWDAACFQQRRGRGRLCKYNEQFIY